MKIINYWLEHPFSDKSVVINDTKCTVVPKIMVEYEDGSVKPHPAFVKDGIEKDFIYIGESVPYDPTDKANILTFDGVEALSCYQILKMLDKVKNDRELLCEIIRKYNCVTN